MPKMDLRDMERAIKNYLLQGNASVNDIEIFLGYQISADVLESMETYIDDAIEQMTDEKLLYFYKRLGIKDRNQENEQDCLTALLNQADEALNNGNIGNGSIGYRIFECVSNDPLDAHALIDAYKDADKKEHDAMDKVLKVLTGYTMKTLLMDALMGASEELEQDETELE